MTKHCKIVLNDEVFCKITGLQPADNNFLFEKFGIMVEGAFFMPAVKLGRWDGKIRYFEKTGKTYTRILDEIVPYLVQWGYNIDLEDNRAPIIPLEERVTEDRFINFIGYGNKPVEIRPYQVESVNTLIENGSGFVIAGTGAGKTIICAALCDAYGVEGYRTITIVPSDDLVTQTYEAYMMVGMDVGTYSGTGKDLAHTHVIATWQSLQNNPHIMRDFQMVLIDEAHGAKASVVQKLICEYGSHIAFRYGVTGTFPKPESDQYTLRSTIGPILKVITSKWLRDNGYLAEVEIEIVQTQDHADLPDYLAEKAFLSRCEPRLDLIAQVIQEKAAKYGNTLVLVNSIQFGRKLTKLIPNSIFMSGETDKYTRKENYDEFDDNDGIIKIASSGIASTGISIDRIFCLITVDAGKSFIKTVQSIGRGTRKARDKYKVWVIDICSNLKYSKKHLRDRKKWYKETEYEVTQLTKMKYAA